MRASTRTDSLNLKDREVETVQGRGREIETDRKTGIWKDRDRQRQPSRDREMETDHKRGRPNKRDKENKTQDTEKGRERWRQRWTMKWRDQDKGRQGRDQRQKQDGRVQGHSEEPTCGAVGQDC